MKRVRSVNHMRKQRDCWGLRTVSTSTNHAIAKEAFASLSRRSWSQLLRLFCAGVLQPVNLGGALQGFGDAAANIFRADVALELRLFHQLGWLWPRTAKQERAPRFVQ